MPFGYSLRSFRMTYIHSTDEQKILLFDTQTTNRRECDRNLMKAQKEVVHKFYKLAGVILSMAALLLVAGPVEAQEPLPQDLIKQVSFEQKLNKAIPLDLPFTDSTGQPVRLGDYFYAGGKPVILALGYYQCPMLCSMVRNGLVESLKDLKFVVGQQFDVLIVSIDPAETPDIAEAKRRASMMDYGRSMSGEGWNFLVGDEESIRQLADAIGFKYAYDPKLEQYVHPSGIVVLTPQGKIARYFYGIDYPAQDLRLGLVEAAESKIGSPVDQALLLCYQYDPVSGQYSLFIMNLVRLAGLGTVAVLGGVLFVMFRHESRTKEDKS